VELLIALDSKINFSNSQPEKIEEYKKQIGK